MLSLRRVVSTAASGIRRKHTLPDLPYDYAALEPVVSREIMAIHHTKHHQAYVTNLNAAEEKLKVATSKGDISAIIELAPALRFNGGGHINHSIFWQNLSPAKTQPIPELCNAITNCFGSMEKMKKALATSSIGVQGSGWGWLGYEKETGLLRIATCGQQNPLQATTGLIPLFGIDVWEHAYYLQYKNVRADYVNAIFDIINWKDVSERYKKANASC